MAGNFDDQGDGAFRRRRPRPVTDFGSSMIQWMDKRRPAYRGTLHYEQERPSQSYMIDILPPAAKLSSPAESVPVRHLHTSLGKSKKPVTVVRWMPEGRRLLAGVHNGEFMLWNGMSFNFETVTAMGSSSLRAAEWSNRKDWLVAANDEGTIYYLQATLNNPHQFQGHGASIRDLAFSPTDTKFVTASDDNTLKIWDFTSSTEESSFKDHGWDVKACDWHPTKGLVVSGSKDHSVRLWDPRTSRNLTTLHGHKNAITATVFSRLRNQLLATAARDGQTRIFDLRMMRDVAVLRGHEKGITTIAWHPVHPELISTGGDDGALFSYLLSEPNTPPGINTAILSPYNASDPRSVPAQSIYPAHKIQHAHESSIWSLDWHPLGHILASGSNDHFTRFWSRSLPNQPNCFRDQFHLGEEAAEAQGTWSRGYGRKQAKEQEEEEEEDEEADKLDQDEQKQDNNAFTIPGLPGLPGIGAPNVNTSFPGIPPNGLPAGLIPPPPPPSQFYSSQQYPQHPLPPPIPGMSPEVLANLIKSAQRPGSSQGQPQLPYPLPIVPPSSTQNAGGPNIDFSKLQFPPNLPPPPPLPGMQYAGGQVGLPGLPGLSAGGDPAAGFLPGVGGSGAGDVNSGGRRRAPLPSQQEGFKAEQARGNFRVAR